ncbi:MAG: hypothetical protein ACPG3X_01545 [Opitutales bacterium]
MPLRYKSKGMPELPSDFRQVVEDALGPVDWQDAHTGFCSCTAAIALIVIISAITLPILLPAFIPDITIFIAYYDTARGFWPWSSTYETINRIAIGSGLRPIVISPVRNNILITIIGMFFGNQITKR